jgi:hypothetical protein
MESEHIYKNHSELLQKAIDRLKVELQILKSIKRKLEIHDKEKLQKLAPSLSTSSSSSGFKQAKITKFFGESTQI